MQGISGCSKSDPIIEGKVIAYSGVPTTGFDFKSIRFEIIHSIVFNRRVVIGDIGGNAAPARPGGKIRDDIVRNVIVLRAPSCHENACSETVRRHFHVGDVVADDLSIYAWPERYGGAIAVVEAVIRDDRVSVQLTQNGIRPSGIEGT